MNVTTALTKFQNASFNTNNIFIKGIDKCMNIFASHCIYNLFTLLYSLNYIALFH